MEAPPDHGRQETYRIHLTCFPDIEYGKPSDAIFWTNKGYGILTGDTIVREELMFPVFSSLVDPPLGVCREMHH